MSDFAYPLVKDNTKTVPLYHHEQVPYQSLYRQPASSHNASPVIHNSNNNTTDQNSSASGDLQDIIYSYQSQPELLKLILSSKLEEDKRRAEEAKLRAKELDLLLSQQNLQNGHATSLDDAHDYAHLFQTPLTTSFAITPPVSQSSSTDGRLYSSFRRGSLDALLQNPLLTQNHARRDSTLGSSFTTDSDDLEERTFSPIPTSTPPISAPSLLSTIESYQPMLMSSLKPSEDYTPEIRPNTRYAIPPKPRRRREMQAITKIVETREFPYMDGYFWKNNGNTVQKKTGNKSVYYKCSNSNKGCPVNKTVTWKANDEYLIKYRGEHLLECNKVQRIVDV